MSIVNKDEFNLGKKGVDWESLSSADAFNALNYQQKRYLNYPTAGVKDIGHLYDMIDTLVTALSSNGIAVPFDADEQFVLDYRKLIKDRIPKT